MPEPVGSPAVLFYRVSNLPLRVVRSLLINLKGGIVMGKIRCNLTVYFEEPFWVGVFEVIENHKISAARVVFGAEPKDYELFEYVLRYYTGLHFSPAVDTVVKDIAKNPKRIQREARKQTSATGIGTKSQQAEKREFELKQQKKREKHRGH